MYESLKGKRLLFVGGIRRLCEAVETAKAMGVYTMVTDYLPDSPAKKIADKSFMVSTTDIDAMVELCRKEKVDGIFTGFIDSMLPCCREIADRLGIPFYASREQIRLSLDKTFFKSVCRENGVPVPEDYTEQAKRDPNDSAICYPVIVKPIDSSGGRGVVVCRDSGQLRDAYDYAMSISPGKNVLVEEYVEGDEFTATYTMSDGDVSLTLVKDKLMSHDHPNITSQGDVLVLPSKYMDLYMEKVNDPLIRMMKAIGATDGSAFFQGICAGDRMVLFECGYRINGACDYRHSREANGVDYLKMMIAHALTGKMEGYDAEKENPYFSKNIVAFSLWGHGGVIGKQEGIEDVLNLDNVIFAEYMHEPGEKLADDNTLNQRVFRATVVDTDMERIKVSIRRIQELITVTDVEGNNMLYKPFDTERLNK